MRLGDERESSNFEDRTGRGGGGLGFGGGGMGGGLFPMLFGLVLSRFGIGGVLFLLLGYCALTTFGGGGAGGGSIGGTPALQSGAPSAGSTLDPQTATFLRKVLGSTEDQWTALFSRTGQQYRPTTLVAYSNSDQSGCGAAQAAMGPFYCPTDEKIYLDPTFFQELQTRFGASGDFAQAYVIAHEVGHHVQHLTGVLDQARSAQQRLSGPQANAVQVKVELQADCYAGVWAANERDNQGRPLLEPGDLQEGMRAAEAIGDDTLQRQAQGRVRPESFTHGSAAQRMAALRKGLDTGDPTACQF
jgi:predicted metalloprotease